MNLYMYVFLAFTNKICEASRIEAEETSIQFFPIDYNNLFMTRSLLIELILNVSICSKVRRTMASQLACTASTTRYIFNN